MRSNRRQTCGRRWASAWLLAAILGPLQWQGAPQLQGAQAQGRYAPQGNAQRLFQEGERHLGEAGDAGARGDAEAQRRALRAALDAFSEALEEDPNYVAVYPKLGLIYYTLEQPQIALPLLRRGKAQAPDDLEITFWLGNHLLSLGQTEEALRHLQLVADADQLPQVHLVLGDHHYAAGDYEAAQRHLERYTAARPDDLNALAKLGNAWFKLRQPARALAAFQAVQRQDPDNLLIAINIGNAHYSLGDYAAAVEILSRAAQRAPDRPSVLFNLAQSRFKLGQLDAALAGYDQFLALRPKSFNGHYFRGSALMDLGRSEAALAALQRATEIKGDVAQPHYKIGLLQLRAGRLSAAKAALSQAQRLAPNDPWVISALGTLARRQGDAAQALALHQRAVSLSPKAARLHGNLALTTLEAGQPQAAVEAAQRALDLDPKDAWVKQAALRAFAAGAQAEIFAGRAPEALALLDRALALSPSDPALLIDRALALLSAGQPKAAEDLAQAQLDALPPGSPLRSHGQYALGLARLAQPKPAQHKAAVRPLAEAAGAKPNQAFAGAAVAALVAAGRDDDALVMAEDALKAWPGDPILSQAKALASLRRAWGDLARGAPRRGDVIAALRVDDAAGHAWGARAHYLAAVSALRRGDGARARPHLAALRRLPRSVLAGDAPSDHVGYLSAAADALQGRWQQVYSQLNGAPAEGTPAGAALLRHACLRLADAAWGERDAKAAARWLAAASRVRKDALTRHNQAVLTFTEGKIKKAEQQWRALLGQIPEARFNLAVALDAQGRLDEAAEQYSRHAQAGGPGADEAKAAVEARRQIFGGAP